MGTIVAISNEKGGVGKTTIAVHLAAYLVRQGLRVVVVDGDPQGNATSWILDGDLNDGGIFRLLVIGESLQKVLRPVESWGGLQLLPGNSRTAEAMIFLTATGKPVDTVSRCLRPLTEISDVVLLDMPPSRAAGFKEILMAADWVVVPTQLERLSLEGVNFMAHAVLSLREEHGKGPRLLGVVPNMVRQTNEHRDQLDGLVAKFGQSVWPPVPLSVKVAEACSYGRTMFDYAPNETVTAALELVAQRFVQNVK
jgi:chromosome partitioning protein